MEIGIVGLPNVGKSTLFNALTRSGAQAANFPFCTIEPNVGVVEVPDSRLTALASMFLPKRVVPATVRFVDIAGLVKGASQGEGLGNQFLAHIRQVDAIVHVVRCFADSQVVHVEGAVNPVKDVETIELELALADLEAVERRLSRVAKLLKSGEKKHQAEEILLQRLRETLNEGRAVRSLQLNQADQELLGENLPLLTIKPMVYGANVGEEDLPEARDNPAVAQLKARAAAQGDALVVINAQLEAEVAELDGESRRDFLSEYGLTASGLDQLIRTGYELLGLITFFTAGEPEVRAWTIRRGLKAPQAAGKIHSDFERGFIRAEVVALTDLLACGSLVEARERGLLRLEGKEYVVKDGDVIHFRFNV